MLSIKLIKGNIKLGFIVLFLTTNTYVFSQTGASRIDQYIHLLHLKKVGIVANQTSTIKTTHLVDTLLALDINIVKIFTPEHGFRGEYSAGENVQDGIDFKTGISIASLYGSNKKPTEKTKEKLLFSSKFDCLKFPIKTLIFALNMYISIHTPRT